MNGNQKILFDATRNTISFINDDNLNIDDQNEEGTIENAEQLQSLVYATANALKSPGLKEILAYSQGPSKYRLQNTLDACGAYNTAPILDLMNELIEIQ